MSEFQLNQILAETAKLLMRKAKQVHTTNPSFLLVPYIFLFSFFFFFFFPFFLSCYFTNELLV